MINIEDFKKIDIRIGEILSAVSVDGSEKLLKLQVSFGEFGERQIVSGIRKYFPEPEVLLGKKLPFVVNLEPRVIFGLESNGMVLCASADDTFSLIEADSQVPAGTEIR